MALGMEQEPCFILHTRPYLESSLLIDLLTLSRGRAAAVAHGVRRSPSALKASLQPFIALEASLTAGRNGLWRLRDCSARGPLLALAVPQVFCATYLNELLYHLYRSEEGSAQLFACYLQTLQGLADASSVQAAALLLRRFELCLLEVLGYGIDFAVPPTGSFLPAAQYTFTPAQGFALSAEGDGLVMPGALLNDLRAGRWEQSPEHCRALRSITAQALQVLLGGQTLRSRELYRSYLAHSPA